MGEAKLAQQPADGVVTDRDAEARLGDASQIGATPADDAVRLEIGPFLDQLFDLGLLLGRQLGWPPRRGVVDQRIDATGIEGMHPVAQRLAIHPAEPRRRFPAGAVANSRQRQQPARLAGILGGSRGRSQLNRSQPLLEHYRHHPSPPRINRITGERNHIYPAAGIQRDRFKPPHPDQESANLRIGIRALIGCARQRVNQEG